MTKQRLEAIKNRLQEFMDNDAAGLEDFFNYLTTEDIIDLIKVADKNL